MTVPPEMSSLFIRLTEPVVPLRSTSRHHDGREPMPPAIVRGLVTLKLAKPTKVCNIELELQAKATTLCTQGAGPTRTHVTEQYKVHSVSTVVFKAGSVAQERRRAASSGPRVWFLDDHTGSVNDARWRAPSDDSNPHAVTRSASLGPLWVRRRLSSDELDDYGASPPPGQPSIEPAPPYFSPAEQRFSLSANSDAADRSRSVASSSRITDPISPVSYRRTLSLDTPYDSPTFSGHSTCDTALSAPSTDEHSGDDGESSDGVAYYGLSRIATSRSPDPDHRDRSHSRFSFEKVVHVFATVKDYVRSRSPRTGSRTQLADCEERGRSLAKAKSKTLGNARDVNHALLPQVGGAAERSVANDQNDDDWIIFPEGTYTYPIFFTIPNNSPPTIKAEHGSLIWKVKAEVTHLDASEPIMTAQKEVVVIYTPKDDDDSGEVDGVDLQRQWGEDLQYHVQITRRSVPVGGKVPFQLTLMPLTRVKVHSISVHLDERTEYYTQAESRARSGDIRRSTLLTISQHSDERQSKPILPLVPDEPDAFRKSPLYRFVSPEQDETEAASFFMAQGPWTICDELKVPDSCSMLYPSNRTKGSNVMVDHTLKLILRVEKEDGLVASSKNKLYDIVIHVPVQILSCHCTPEWTFLPRYEVLQVDDESPEDTSTCPSCTRRRPTKARANSHTAPVERYRPPQTANSNSPGAPSNLLARRTHLHERLMSGLVSETGESPPSYESSGADL